MSGSASLEEIQTKPVAAPLLASQVQMGRFRSPAKIVSIFDPDEWEEFTNEWVAILPGYAKVGRISGAGDRGVDVAGWLSESGFAGDWDAYQCKHYNRSLEPADAYKEIFKLFLAVLDGVWALPQRYFFVAPKGCGPSLMQYLNGGRDLRAAFLDRLQADIKTQTITSSSEDRVRVETYAASVDFAMFREISVEDALSSHKQTDRYVLRFGGGMPPKPTPEPVPEAPTSEEAPYLSALWPVYTERYGTELDSFETCVKDTRVSNHLLRQREAFYSAETLKRHVRDLLPPGAYDAYQEDVYVGVVDTCEATYPSGYDRLGATMAQAARIDISANALVQSSEIKDKQGACHQLAGDEGLRWVATP
ncbi:ABC-three component system protein [Knoellia sp. S7-12]|uniref:ABC-three component system protein n=1 Tax=Knoellia sp. S7-12 TaxID=3126698 RepID=UPI003368D4F5